MLGIIGASGKIGGATLSALLSNDLIPASQIIALTSAKDSSDKRWQSLRSQGVQVRHGTFDDADSIITALNGCDRLFLVSSPRIALDYNDAPPGTGREKDHKVAIDAAVKAGVKHIYYTSLAFGNPSKSGVMAAHIRTEAYLKGLMGIKYTIIREGLYQESWPLYFGHFDLKNDHRTEIVVAGDCPISWTAIADLGLASALVIAAPGDEYNTKTFYLSDTRDPKSLKDVAKIVSGVKGKTYTVKIVSREEHEKFYVQERKMDERHIKWWVKTYDALNDQECCIKDTTFEKLLASKGREAKRMEDTIREMLSA